MRHQTETGGDVIGYCGCQTAPAEPSDEVVASAPASPHASLLGVLSDALSAEIFRPRDPEPLVAEAALNAAGSSPPRLTGSGFRC